MNQIDCSACEGTGMATVEDGVDSCTACAGTGRRPAPSVALLAQRDAIAEGYTELAEWADRHPDVSLYPSGALIYAFAPDQPTFQAWVRALADGAPIGGVRKEIGTQYASATRRFGPLNVQVTIARTEVCERVVTGTRKVEVPDPEVVAAAPLVTVDEDIVEWRCPPSFLADHSA